MAKQATGTASTASTSASTSTAAASQRLRVVLQTHTRNPEQIPPLAWLHACTDASAAYAAAALPPELTAAGPRLQLWRAALAALGPHPAVLALAEIIPADWLEGHILYLVAHLDDAGVVTAAGRTRPVDRAWLRDAMVLAPLVLAPGHPLLDQLAAAQEVGFSDAAAALRPGS